MNDSSEYSNTRDSHLFAPSPTVFMTTLLESRGDEQGGVRSVSSLSRCGASA
jgi:hypothetical protein